MNFNKLSKGELKKLVIKLENDKEKAISGWLNLQKKHSESLERFEQEVKALMEELRVAKECVCRLEYQLEELGDWEKTKFALNDLLCLLVLSLRQLDGEGEEHSLTTDQESLISTTDYLREVLMKKAS